MEDRHRRHEKDGSEKDQGAASTDQQQTERRHSSHGKKRHKHRSKKTKTGAGHSPRTHESVENERKAAGTAALSLSANTNVGESNNARQHHDPFAENAGADMRSSTEWDEEVCILVEMGFTATQASHALEVCGGNTKDAYGFLSSLDGGVSSSYGETNAAALASRDLGIGFDANNAKQVVDVDVDGPLDSSSTLNPIRTPRPPQTDTTPGAFPVGGTNSVTGTVIVGTPHQDEQAIHTRSIVPVEAEIVEDDLQERRELEAQLQRVLEERENVAVAQVVVSNSFQNLDDTSYWWSKRRNRLMLLITMFLIVAGLVAGLVASLGAKSANDHPSSDPNSEISSPTRTPVPTSAPQAGPSSPSAVSHPTTAQLPMNQPPTPAPTTTLPPTEQAPTPPPTPITEPPTTLPPTPQSPTTPPPAALPPTLQSTGDFTAPFSCNGEVDFNSAGDTIIYAVSGGDSCKVYALGHGSLDVKWESPELAGVCEGTPRYADEDAYVFVTHNAADGSAGRFSVLDTAAGATVIYTTEVTEGPFGPFGFYPSPFPGGNYGAGAGNTNDLAVWGLKPSPSATGSENGGLWAFQMPPITAIGGPNVTKIVETTSWRHTSPPRIANMGQWAYWLVSRSAIRAWYSSPWTVGADGEYNFDRGVPSSKAAPYTPAINGDVPTILCGGPADESFACMDATNIVPSEGGGAPLWSVNTTGNGIYGDPVMSPDYSRVYWTDNAGLVSSADPSTGMDGWTASSGVTLEANPVLSSDGGRLFFGDVTGNIACWDVAETTLPVPAPPVPGPGAPAPAPAPSMEGLAPSTTLVESFAPTQNTLGSSRALQFADPVPKWTATFRPMLDNTGLVWAPDDSAVYATSSDGAVALFSPDDGTLLGEFEPTV